MRNLHDIVEKAWAGWKEWQLPLLVMLRIRRSFANVDQEIQTIVERWVAHSKTCVELAKTQIEANRFEFRWVLEVVEVVWKKRVF